MSNSAPQNDQPPKLRLTAEGSADIGSLADVLEWFLNFDETHRPHEATRPSKRFSNGNSRTTRSTASRSTRSRTPRPALPSARFQALAENDTEPKLNRLDHRYPQRPRRRPDVAHRDLGILRPRRRPELYAVAKADKLTTAIEKRIYLTSSWIEALCTAEARYLGWSIRKLYGKPFHPKRRRPE